ncbi:phage terminase large subunit [Endozoicomonas sp. SM1973]|uniref:Phage terminase large subunit n=1 Tax=Spartinivicinus marinus TaxID=2994442 RepID=A0A853IAX7_9GAMM|nr:phage terminase large subunit [Spartinivicinus marinus]MCX4025064.1 phage terminase large subunit [Spartinivicinus marinus]NYZ68982.1 phage terminase large subunit [Spartinivicinus marinus]
MAEKLKLLALLEKKLALRAANSLDAYCRFIEIPGVPLTDDDCECFYPDTVEPAEHHQLINKTLEQVEQGSIKRVMLFMPPGSAKSTYASVVFPTWFMGRNPRKNIISTSYGSDLAKKFGRKCRAITRSEQFKTIFNAELNQDNQAVDNWSLTNSATYMAGGILSGITGNRADGLIIDDPVKGFEQAESVTIRDKTWDAYLTDLRTRLKPSGWIIIIQTRWHEDDLSGRILPPGYEGQSGWVNAQDGEEWYVICLQALCEREDDPLGRQIGEYLWTDWFSPEHWQQERISQGSRNWDALYQQRPAPAEGGLIKRAWIKRYKALPANPIRIIHSWDTAYKPDQINDPSVATVWMETKFGYYLVDVWRERVEYPHLKTVVRALADKWGAQAILIEDKASGQSLIQELRLTTSLPIIAIEPEGDKLTRMSSQSATIEAGKVFLPESGCWLVDYEREIFVFPLSEHDDQVDSTSQFLKWVNDHKQQFEYKPVKGCGTEFKRKKGAW